MLKKYDLIIRPLKVLFLKSVKKPSDNVKFNNYPSCYHQYFDGPICCYHQKLTDKYVAIVI